MVNYVDMFQTLLHLRFDAVPCSSLNFEENMVFVLHLWRPVLEIAFQCNKVFCTYCILTIGVFGGIVQQLFSKFTNSDNLCNDNALLKFLFPIFKFLIFSRTNIFQILVQHIPYSARGLASIYDIRVNKNVIVSTWEWEIFYNDSDAIIVNTKLLWSISKSFLNSFVDSSFWA